MEVGYPLDIVSAPFVKYKKYFISYHLNRLKSIQRDNALCNCIFFKEFPNSIVFIMGLSPISLVTKSHHTCLPTVCLPYSPFATTDPFNVHNILPK